MCSITNCINISVAVPDIKWLKGDKVIKPSKYFQMQKDGDVYTLRISEAFPEDEGVYKCIATNSAGDVTLSAELRVLGEGQCYIEYCYSSVGTVLH
jgi:hypothetical protein